MSDDIEESQDAREDGDGLAPLADRIVAFSLDLALFALGWGLTLRALELAGNVRVDALAGGLYALWAVLFVIYQAYANSEGRQSVGKRLLGLRVVSLDREPLGLGQAILRSVTYVVSSILSLGFLWAFFNRSRQTWHDMVAGSVVISEAPVTHGRRLLVRAAAMACLAIVAGQWYWRASAAPRYHDIMSVAAAEVGLKEIVLLQEQYHRRHGRYANSLHSLAPLSGAPDIFLRDMGRMFKAHSVALKGDKKKFTVKARATDRRETLIAFNSR